MQFASNQIARSKSAYEQVSSEHLETPFLSQSIEEKAQRS
jgi:hypothetical protein